MAAPTLGSFLQRLKQAMTAEAVASCSDQELVEQFRSRRDDGVFRAILERHGPMVYQVCRRALSSPADVEDAFQATFLILIRRAHTLRRQGSLASWLHGVAWRTALKLRTKSDRRRRRESLADAEPQAVSENSTWKEVRAILDEELNRLSESARGPLVFCYLEGRTQDEAAAQLAVSKSTLRRRLEKSRQVLARRLARRGVALSAVGSAQLISDCAQGAGLSSALIVRTVQSACHTATGIAAPAGVVSTRVAALCDGVIKTMNYAKYKSVVASLACCLAIGFGVYQASPELAFAQQKGSTASATPPKGSPDIEPVDPGLVFDANVQKQLRLSQNQIRQLTEARDKGRESKADQGKRVSEIDAQLKKLQEQMEKLSQERSVALQAIHKAESEQVKSEIPKVLSRDAVDQLRQITLQRMRLADVLLDPRIRARLELNDEQIKKIQAIQEKPGFTADWIMETRPSVLFANRQFDSVWLGSLNTTGDILFYDAVGGASRSELLKLLTPQQRQTLERLSGMTFEKDKK
jgi:RNA polymerase sigma factor (sigma-70 family)